MNTLDNTTTFYRFIQNHEVQIPMIQRDYVQGRAMDSKAEEKRDDFISILLNALLTENKPYNLDFIYGARENYGGAHQSDSNAPFLPLDGQQRLTTLYLLHWYLLHATQPIGEAGEDSYELFCTRKAMLSKFSYMTRISSRRFCKKLTETSFESTDLVKQIKSKYWYDKDMKADPTIQAMIEMLKAITNKLSNEMYTGRLKEMTDNLFDKEKITFHLLDMEKYNLTDGLYVKMNARGKELTQFENWKADFIGLISECNADKERFTRGIEHEWNDIFWPIAYNRYCDELQNNNSDKDVEYPRIDESFMNFFDNFSRLLYFISTTSKDPKAEDFRKGLWSTTKEIFENVKVRTQFFDMLDTLSEIKKQTGIENFFNNIFYTDASTDWQNHTSKVKLFGTKINLFDTTCSSNEFEWSHVMLYAILSYCTRFKLYEPDDDLRNYVRVCRNYLDEHNYFSKENVTIVSQVRANDMKKYEEVFSLLQTNRNVFDTLAKPIITNEYIDTESNKYVFYKDTETLKLVRKIEDMSYTHGNIKAFITWLNSCKGDAQRCKSTWQAIYDFIHASPLQKVQLFCIFGYRGINVKSCTHGQAVFLGGEFDGTPRWMVHFRQKTQNKTNHVLDDWFCKYMEDYMKFGKIQDILDRYTGNAVTSPSTTVDYMLKYPYVLASQVYWRNNQDSAPFYYAMQNPWSDFDIITIHSISKAPLNRAYQTCPMANAVARQMTNFHKYHVRQPSRIAYSGEGATKMGIYINKDGDWNQLLFHLWFNKTEWITNSESYSQISSQLQSMFIQDEFSNNYILKTNDLIADAVKFMDALIIEFEKNSLI